MARTIFRRKDLMNALATTANRVTNLEIQTSAANVTPGSTTQDLAFQSQATSFSGAIDQGDARINPTGTTSTIDEETNAAVAAYATFDDLGGNAAASADVLGDATTVKVPLLDVKGKTAYYRGDPKYLEWIESYPNVSHTKQFMAGNSVSLNVPGTAAQDQKAFVYYDSNAAFNLTAQISISLWFYPTDTSDPGGGYRYLFYRYIDASNYFFALIDTGDSTHNRVKVAVNEAAVLTRLRSAGNEPVDNAWNNIIITYDPTPNTLLLYINNVLSTTTSTTTITPPYTTNSNMYFGGLPGLSNRFTGYMDNPVFWTGKILTSTEVSNMWNHGTIV